MPNDERELRELARLANARTLSVHEYERMATAIFGNALAQDEAKAKLWQKREARMITFGAYTHGRKQLEDTTVIDNCWKRIRQDLYERRRPAASGVQLSLGNAKRSGLLNNPRWGGERKRIAEQILRSQGVDINAPAGLSYNPETVGRGAPDAPQREEFVAPDIGEQTLSISEKLGIADYWLKRPVSERHLLNAILSDFEPKKRVRFVIGLAGDEISKRDSNRDIPRVEFDWLRDFPARLGRVVDALPERSQETLGALYQQSNNRALHNAVGNMMIESRDRATGEDLLGLLLNHVANTRDSFGARRRYEMELDQGKRSLHSYMRLVERYLPKLARQERELAKEHAEQRHQQYLAEAMVADPGLQHMRERYAQMWEIANRSEFQKLAATGRGFGKAAWGTVEGIFTLITTDPRKTAAGIYHLVKNPGMLIVALDDAAVDGHELTGALLFELLSTAVGAGPAAKASQAQKVVRLANAAQDAAKAGRMRAAKRLADAAEAAMEKAKGKSSSADMGQAQQALRGARESIDSGVARGAPNPNPNARGMSPHSGPRDAPRSNQGPMRDNIKHRYRFVALGGFKVKGTEHLFIQGTAEQVRRIDVRVRQLQRFPEGRKLIQELDDALERVAQTEVDAAVRKTAKEYGWTSEALINAERMRLLQKNRQNKRVVIKWTGEKGRIQCEPLRADAAFRDDAARAAGEGSGSIVHFDPDRWVHIADDGSKLRPPTPAIALGHELVHALRNARGQANTMRGADEFETIGLDDIPDWVSTGQRVTENDLRTGWAKLQEQVAELRTDY